MQIKPKELAAALAALASLGPVHAAYLATISELGKAKLQEYDLDFSDGHHPLMYEFIFFPSLVYSGEAAENPPFIELLTEGGGFETFEVAQRSLATHLRRVYPALWAALGGQAEARPRLHLILSSKADEKHKRAHEFGYYDLLSNQIHLRTASLTQEALLARHPIFPHIKLPLLLALDPCLQSLYGVPALDFFHSVPMSILIHECLHALRPVVSEAYDPQKHGVWSIANPKLEITEIIQAGQTWYALVCNRLTGRRVKYLALNQAGFSTPLLQFEEGVVERLTALKLPQISALVADPFLTTRPDWQPAWFPQKPLRLYHHYAAETLLTGLNETEIEALREARITDAWSDALALAPGRAGLDEAQAKALLIWLLASLGIPAERLKAIKKITNLTPTPSLSTSLPRSAAAGRALSRRIDELVAQLTTLQASPDDGYGWHLVADWIEAARAAERANQAVRLPLPR